MENEEKELPLDESDETNVATIDFETLASLIDSKNRAGLLDVFEHVPAIDIAEIANDLEPTQLIYVFRVIGSSWTAEFFEELSQDAKESLIAALTDKELVVLINNSAADDIADTVGDMPANLATRVLRAADKEMRSDINTLLRYEDGTAGALMTTEYLEILDSTTVEDTIEYVRKRGKDAETIYTIFVRNRQRQFVGTVDLDDLIFAKKDEKIRDIMDENVVSCSTQTDQEEIAQMFSRYDLNAMAVLNDDQRLVGVITIDDAVDVLEEEATEDFARLSHMEPTEEPYLETKPWDNAKKCIPWLGALLVLGTFVTMVLNRLESQAIFTAMPILVAFVPSLMDTGGNAGAQTTGLMIRGLAKGDLEPKDTLKILWREVRSAAIVAGAVALFAFIWISIEQYTGIVSLGQIGTSGPDFTDYMVWNGLAFTGEYAGEFAQHVFLFSGLVGLTMGIAVLTSKVVGALLPMGAAAIKKDPALLSQPMLTTIMDVTTLLIYFAISCAFFPAYAGF